MNSRYGSHCCRSEHGRNRFALIDDGGDISIGRVAHIDFAARASDEHNTLATLVRREGETLNALTQRPDKAIGRYYDTDETTDEINPP